MFFDKKMLLIKIILKFIFIIKKKFKIHLLNKYLQRKVIMLKFTFMNLKKFNFSYIFIIKYNFQLFLKNIFIRKAIIKK